MVAWIFPSGDLTLSARRAVRNLLNLVGSREKTVLPKKKIFMKTLRLIRKTIFADRATRRRLLKPAACLVVALLAVASVGCPAPKDDTADLKAEVARLKAEADAKTKTQVDGAVAKTDAAAESAAAAARAAADAQARTTADVAQAEAAVAKAQAEADEAAKSAAAAQTSFVAAQGEADKAKEVVEQVKTEAEESQKAAAAPTATESDVAKAEADADKLALEVAKAEAARLKAELARAKVTAAATKIKSPISEKVSDFLLALSTAILGPSGGTVYPLGLGSGALVIPPGAFASGSLPFLMHQPPIVVGTTSLSSGGGFLGIAQLTPAGQTFSPPAMVYIDLKSYETPKTQLQLEEQNAVTGIWALRTPPVYGTVQASGMVALVYLDHFCTVAVTKPAPGSPPPPGPPQMVDPPPPKAEVIAKANKEAAAAAASDKQLAESYKVAANTARVQLAKKGEEQKVAAKDLADKNAKKLADEKAKAAADKKIADLKKQKAKVLAETKAIEKQNSKDQAAAKKKAQEEKNRKTGDAIGGFLRALGEGSQNNQQQNQQQQEQQRRQQQQQQEEQQRRQQQQQQNEDNPNG